MFIFGSFHLPDCSLSGWRAGRLNENTNGLMCQYFPKEIDFTTITEQEIKIAMNKLNSHSRKCLSMKTPDQVFFRIKPAVALAG